MAGIFDIRAVFTTISTLSMQLTRAKDVDSLVSRRVTVARDYIGESKRALGICRRECQTAIQKGKWTDLL